MNRQVFKSNFILLAALYGYKPEEKVTKIYWNILKTLSNEMFEQIVSHIVSHFKPSSQCPFPTPAHFADLINELELAALTSALTAVRKAVSEVGPYESITFDDPALHDTIERYGGWVEICNWSHNDWKMKEKAFLHAYSAAKSCNAGTENHLPGITERENRLNNHEKWIPEPIKISVLSQKMADMKKISNYSLKLE